MPLTPVEAARRAPDLLELIRDAVRAGQADSPGGKRFTPEEWLELGQDLGIIVARTVVDARD